MTKTKKVVAVMLAFLMIFSSASVLASAWDASVDDGSTLEISTKFFKEVNGEWVETEKVRVNPADTVKARVYLGTDYYSNGSTLLFFYDKDFFTHTYSTSGVNSLKVNTEAGSFAAANNVYGNFVADYDMSADAEDNGIDSSFLADHSAMYVSLHVGNGGKNVMFDDSTWLFEFEFTVAGDADGEGDLFVKESTIQNTSNEYALIDVPKGPSNGSAVDTWPMYLWDATPVLNSQPVSTLSSVTFDANGGEYNDGTDSYVVEDLIDTAIDSSTIPVPSKTGYSFMGWIDAADTTPTYEEIIDIPSAIPENDLVLNAYWMENVTITFETGEGTPIAPHENVTPYADFADVTPPTREGYTFVGWDVRGNMDLPETYPAESTTYTAVWALNVTVSFNTNGGTEIDPIDGVEGEPFDASAVAKPEKAGHNFIMWSPALPTQFPEEDTTYNAIFETKTYTIWYYAVDENGKKEASAATQFEYGTVIPTNILTMKLPEGKVFASETWFTDEACTIPLAEGATVEGNMTLYRDTKYDSYDAIFIVDGEEYARVETVYGAEIAKPANPAKEGYVFDGWSPDPTVLGEPNDMTFYATWREAVNDVIYIVDGSEHEVYDIETGKDLEVPADPYKEGYTFKGWTDVEGSTTAITLPEKMPASTVTYYAIFEINKYTITFDTDEGSEVEAITQDYDTAITAPADPAKTGYTFRGWALTKGATVADKVNLPATMPAENQTYYAIWEINKYTITFVDTGNVAYEAITQNYNTVIEKVADPIKTGYTFTGWDTPIPGTMPAENLTITATWDANSYDAIFDANGGKWTDGDTSKTVPTDYNENIVAPADPAKTGYTFGGWAPAVGKMDDVNGKTFTAIWNANGNTPYTVNVYTMGTDGKYGAADVKNLTGTTATEVTYTPDIATGFELNASSVTKGIVAADGSLVLNVYIDRTTYTLTIKVDDKETTVDYLYEEAVETPETPVKDGWTFAAWDPSVPGTMPANNVTVTATWNINSHKATWDIDGAVTEQTYNYGDTVKAPAASKIGYEFKGWAGDTYTEGMTMPDKDLAFTAVFEAIKYDATFLADGGVFKENNSDTYVVSTAYDSKIVAPANPTKTGFVFSGWTPATGMDIMDTVGGETYTATWSNAKDTPYTVNVYTMGTNGLYGVADVKNLTGETNTTAKYEPEITDGFKVNETSDLEGNIEADGSLVLNVYIDRISYTFKAVSNGETMVEETVLFGAKTPAVSDPENKVGYNFVEWNPGIPATMPAEDLTVTAVWEADTATPYGVIVNYTDAKDGAQAVEFFYEGTSDNAIAIVDEIPDPAADNTEYVLMSDLAVANYVLDTTANNDLTGTVAADGTTVLNLYYVAVKYTATFKAVDGDYEAAFKDGETTKSVELVYNSLVKPSAPADPEREGYTFKGWNGLNDSTRLTGNRDFTPSWEAKPYTITWVLDGVETTETVNCDELIIKKTAPVKTGWTFQYWVDADGNATEIPDTMPAGDLYFETYYTINPHIVTWINDGETEVDNYVYGDTIVVDTPVKDGYHFDGWFDAEGKQPVDYVTVPDKDLTFTAKWTINQYTITFADTGDSTIAPIKQDYNTSITAPSDPTKTGYTFTGWDVPVPPTMPAKDMTITAQWAINQYKITFNADGGVADSTVEADYLSNVNAPAEPTKAGYTFKGWATTKGVTHPAQAVKFPVEMPLNGTTYYAIWVVNEYTISFDTLGGTPAVNSITADYLSNVNKPATEPTKTGYTFRGWSETSGSTTAVTFPYEMPLGGTTLYAIWEIQTYTVTWDNEGDKTTVDYDYDEVINLPTQPTKTGYSFKGWNGYTNGMKMPAENKTFTAIWEANTYNAVFNANDGAWTDGDKSKTVPTKFDANIVAPADPERAGYDFNGWTPAVGKMDDINGKTFEATWLAKGGITYTIETYIMDTTGAYGEPTIERKAGTTDSTVSTTHETKTGFIPDTENSILSGVVAADGSTKLVVKYIRNQYDFTVNVDGNKTPTKYYYEAAVAVPETPVKEGYTFASWNPAVPATMPAENKEVVATWTINKHSVIYMVDGQQYSKIDGIEYGTTVTPITAPEQEGYSFSGWNVTEAFSMPDNDVTISGTFTPLDYTITFDSNGGSKVENITQAYKSEVTAPKDPARDGYTFAGWYDKDGNKVNVPTTMPLGGAALKAEWTAIEYTVTYYVDDTKSEVAYTRTAAYESNYNVPVPAKEGHEFAAWMNADGTPANLPANGETTQIPLNGAEYYATWTVKSYTLYYRAGSDSTTGQSAKFPDDSSAVKTYSVPYGTAQADWDKPVDPEMEGSTFNGWNMPANYPTMPAVVVNVTAKWITENYTVIFNDSLSDEIYSEETLVYGNGVSIPDDPEKEGYSFLYWADANGNEVTPKDTMEDIGADGATLTYTAIWDANSYDAVFDANGGNWTDGDTSKTVPTDYNENIIAPADPAKTGYEFGGWTPAVGKMDSIKGKTFTAIWNAKGDTKYTVNVYTMNVEGGYDAPVVHNLTAATDADVSFAPEITTGFELNANSVTEGKVKADGSLVLNIWIDRQTFTLKTVVDGNVDTSEDYLFGAPVTVVTPSKVGHNFSGWDKDVPSTMPAEDVTLTGSFTARVHTVTYFVDGVEHFSEDVAFGTAVKVLAPLTKDGYTFSGWDKTDFTMPDEDVTINGSWAVNKYDVVYYVDGIEYTRVEDVAYGTEVEVLDPLTKTGYTFSGWDKADFVMPDEEVSINGSWTAINYTVTWVDGIDTTEDKIDTYIYEAEIIAPTDPVKAGYTFKGWEGYTDGMTMPAENKTFTAIWEANSGIGYTVKTYKQVIGGTDYDISEEPFTGKAGDTATYAVKSYEGFTFTTGTNYNADANTVSGTIKGDGTLVLEVYYDRNKITVNVNGEDDEYYYDDVIGDEEGETPETPVDPNGGTFEGWEDEDGNPVEFPYNVPDEEDKEITITPVYHYTVVYMADGAEVLTVKNRAGTVYTVPDASKTGWTFTGWTLDGEDAGLTVGGEASIPVGGATYVAEFTANSGIGYTVKTYKMNGDGTDYDISEEPFTGTAGDTATYAVKTYEGFTFTTGTNYNADANTVSGTIKGDGTLVLEVYYDRNKITVNVNGKEDEYFYDEVIGDEEGETPETPVDPNGGTFEGWEDEDGNPVEFPYNVPDEKDKEITITPVYHYTVVYVAEGTTVHTVKNREGSDLEVPEAPAKVGYKFIKWVDADGNAPADYGTVPAKNVTFTALYETSAYQVYYWVNNKIVSVKSAEYGETIVTGIDADAKKVNLLTYSTPEGYVFDGWYTDADMTAKLADGATVGAARVDLYAAETAGTYDAVFNVDGEEYAVVPTVFGAEIALPEAPAKEGYTFTGWEPSVTIMDAEGMTFEATFVETAGAYTITYKIEGMKDEVFTMAIGDEFEVPADPYKEGYTFGGWSDVEGGTTEVELPETMPAENLTYYAIFTINNYTVNFNNNKALDASPYMSEETEVYVTANYDFGKLIEIPADPTNINSAYYTFMGWTDVEGGDEVKYTAESEITMPEGGLELYAVYERVAVKLVPVAGSKTMIERDGVIESYNDGYTVNSDPYAEPASYEKWFVYGITERRFSATTYNKYVTVQGDGKLVITQSEGGYGTGTKIEVVDNIDGDVKETFYVVIFGDLNGSGNVNSADLTKMQSESAGKTSWQRTGEKYLFRAADLSGDGRRINSADLNILSNIVGGKATIDQTVGHV
ncbi:MAG: InlB B-repeat-containing protein [Clostridia bacterium]|nr:InlB B-repeat-containing protein [Clostridia bacterium]